MSAVANLASQAKLRLERARAQYGAVDVAVSTFKRFSDDDGGTLAAALTYYIFFSVFPLLLFAFSVLGFVTRGNPELRQSIQNAALDAVPLLDNALGKSSLEVLERRAGDLLSTSVVLGLYTGSGAIVALEHSLNRIDRIRNEGTFWERRFRSLRWLVLLGPAALLSAGLSAMAQISNQVFGESSPVALFVSIVAFLGGLLISVCLFAAAFRFLTRAPRSWTEVLPGAVAGALAFELLKVVGSLFLDAGARSRSATFGAFAAAAGFLVAAFLIARITLLAAELNATLAERRLTRRGTPSGDQTGGAP